jgi:RNA polymerase primary sigma factor
MLDETQPDESPKTEEITLPESLRFLAQSQGYLLYDDLLAEMPEIEENMSQLEDIFVQLSRQGLEIYSTLTEALEKKQQILPSDNELAQTEVNNGVELSDLPPDNTLSLYFNDMASTPLLTSDHEIALAKQLEEGRQAQRDLEKRSLPVEDESRLKHLVKQGDQARNHLIKANTRLVVSVAKKYIGQGVPFADLIQEGNLGLMRAADKFDYRRGYRFGTYATWWIRQAVTRALGSQGRTIRVPAHMNDRFRKLWRISRQLEQDWGRRPTPEELAREMDLSSARVRWMLRASQHSVSLEQPVGDESDTQFGDFIKDEDTLPTPDTTDHHLLQEELEALILTLPPREARVLKLRFGLQDGKSYSLEEIGQRFGLTRERIRQLEKRALRRLRHPSRSRPLRGYLD